MIRVLVNLPSPAPRTLEVSGERHHYLAHVLRVKPGQRLEVFDGAGRAFGARVVAVAEASLELTLEEERRDAPQRQVFLVQGLPKGDKLEWIIEKAAELGVAGVLPVRTARAVVRLDPERAEKKRERWQKIAEEAARQCGRADVPAVLPVRELTSIKDALPPGTRVLVLDEGERSRRLAASLPEEGGAVALLVGPEGGFTRDEVQALEQAGALPVTLGGWVLRTETAGIAGICVVRHRDGHLG